jgi:predicted nucleic acid-binding protein
LIAYFDTSVILPLLIADVHDERAQALLRRLPRPYAISDWTVAEVTSVLARNVREDKLTGLEAEVVLGTLRTWIAGSAQVVEVQPQDVRSAADMLGTFKTALRAPDALHIAIAKRMGASLATYDKTMARDAAQFNVDVIVA